MRKCLKILFVFSLIISSCGEVVAPKVPANQGPKFTPETQPAEGLARAYFYIIANHMTNAYISVNGANTIGIKADQAILSKLAICQYDFIDLTAGEVAKIRVSFPIDISARQRTLEENLVPKSGEVYYFQITSSYNYCSGGCRTERKLTRVVNNQSIHQCNKAL